MKRLETPRTLRIPNLDEVPRTRDLINAISKSHSANICEGFVLRPNTTNDLPFKFYAEINIDNSRLWDLFTKLTFHLPEEISLIFNHSDGETIFGKYQNKNSVMKILSNFTVELTQDCFLEFGTIYQTNEFLEEVFVDCTKYIRYWGTDEIWFRATMMEFSISETPNLNFIDEFPKVREALSLHFENIIETDELIEKLRINFT